MSIIQGIIASNASITPATDPGGGQGSIPNAVAGLWRKKFNGSVSNDDPTWFVTNAGLMTSEKVTTAYIQTDGEDTSEVFSLQFLGYFCPAVTGTYKFKTTSDDGSWLWIGIPATDPTNENANVANGGAHGNTTVVGKAVRLTAGIYYPIRVHMWDSGGNWSLDTQWSSDNGLSFSPSFETQIFYNSATNGF
jgi:hypothetical protein